jgi:site-specific DNA-methyltransferase (adenine-specific)
MTNTTDITNETGLPKPFYEDDYATIYHGDCLDILPLLDLGGDAATVTDPPYGVGKTYGASFTDTGYEGQKDKGGDVYWAMLQKIADDLSQLGPVLMTHRVLALRHLTGWDWVAAWVKTNQQSRLFSLPVLPMWEPILCWGICGFRDDVSGHRPDVFHHTAVSPASVPGGHPFPKPPDLMSALIQWVTDECDTVLDPFAGSGTTLRAAKDLGRKSIGIEISEQYCEIAANRLGQEVLAFGDT